MSELVDPVVNLEFYQLSSCRKKVPQDAAEFSTYLKKYIARWAGEPERCESAAQLLIHAAPFAVMHFRFLGL
jgi:hypothetical protein